MKHIYENVILSKSKLNDKYYYLEMPTLKLIKKMEKQTKRFGFVLDKRSKLDKGLIIPLKFRGSIVKVTQSDYKRALKHKCSMLVSVALNHHIGINFRNAALAKRNRTKANTDKTSLQNRRILSNVSFGCSIFKVTSKFHKEEKDFKLSNKNDGLSIMINDIKIQNMDSLDKIKEFEIKRLF